MTPWPRRIPGGWQGPDITGDRAIRPYRLQAARGNVVIDPERSTAEPPEIASTDGASRDRINGRHVRDCINDRWPRSLRVVRCTASLTRERQRFARRDFINPAPATGFSLAALSTISELDELAMPDAWRPWAMKRHPTLVSLVIGAITIVAACSPWSVAERDAQPIRSHGERQDLPL